MANVAYIKIHVNLIIMNSWSYKSVQKGVQKTQRHKKANLTRLKDANARQVQEHSTPEDKEKDDDNGKEIFSLHCAITIFAK